MNETLQTPAELRFGGGWKMLIPFVLLPVAIVSASVGVFLLFGKLAQNEMGAMDYIEQIRRASPHKKWQAAYELSGLLARQDIGPDKDKIETALLDVLQKEGAADEKLRNYALIGLAQVGSARSVPYLEERVTNPENSQVQIYSLLALARIGSHSSASIVERQLKSDDAGIRKTAAYALGFVGTASDIPKLEKLLDDGVNDVRWNAALGLAQLGSASGESELLFLLNPERLAQATPNLRPGERNEIVVSALNAVGKLRLESATLAVQHLSKESPDPRLRSLAQHIHRILLGPL